jgi:hypothetical protein
MTTGCACSTPGCGGITYGPGDRCTRCEIEAMPPGAGRALRQVVHAVLDGTRATRGTGPGDRGTTKEAGS